MRTRRALPAPGRMGGCSLHSVAWASAELRAVVLSSSSFPCFHFPWPLLLVAPLLYLSLLPLPPPCTLVLPYLVVRLHTFFSPSVRPLFPLLWEEGWVGSLWTGRLPGAAGAGLGACKKSVSEWWMPLSSPPIARLMPNGSPGLDTSWEWD